MFCSIAAMAQTNDTIDEVDYFRMRDSLKLPRRNLAKALTRANADVNVNANADVNGEPQVDLRQYVTKDVYMPPHQTFGKKWWDHIYVGAGLGVEKMAARLDNYTFKTLTTFDVHVGKQISKYSDVRLSLTGGWGYQNNTELWTTQFGLRADYMYSLSTLLNGYNPARRMDVSLLVGIGGVYAKMKDKSGAIVPEGHIGVRLKCYTGPLGTINIEPYIGLSGDQLDLSETRNYHRYDLFYGVRVNYSCYLENNLSKEARLKLLQNRLADDRMVDPYTLESWRTPWFFEYAAGLASVTNGLSDDFGAGGSSKIGNEVSIAVGKWLSPVMGFRVTGASRINQWTSYTPHETGIEEGYSSHYVYGRVDALLNPMGFFRQFRWKAQWGGYLSFGVGIGQLTTYAVQELKTNSHSYRLGLHLYGRLSEDLQLFAEPYYATNVYTIPYSNVNMDKMFTDKAFGVNIGMTMLIKSHKYRDLYEMDNTQNYTYKNVRGFRVGVAGGFPVMQNTAPRYDNLGTNWNLMGSVEYRFDHLNSIRLQAELLNFNVAQYAIPSNHRLLLTSLNYMINLTNLCSGRFLDRKVELDAFSGLASGFLLQSDVSMMGLDIGMQLRARVWKRFSVVVTPTVYMMNYQKDIPGLSTLTAGSFHFFHTINFGIQYKVGSLRMNQQKKRIRQAHSIEMWRMKQMEKERKWERKQQLKEQERKSKGYRL